MTGWGELGARTAAGLADPEPGPARASGPSAAASALPWGAAGRLGAGTRGLSSRLPRSSLIGVSRQNKILPARF